MRMSFSHLSVSSVVTVNVYSYPTDRVWQPSARCDCPKIVPRPLYLFCYVLFKLSQNLGDAVLYRYFIVFPSSFFISSSFLFQLLFFGLLFFLLIALIPNSCVERTEWCVASSVFYYRGNRFESSLGHWLFWVRFYVVFSFPPDK
jgi:hypothetical protein